jgi:hypothetical protein
VTAAITAAARKTLGPVASSAARAAAVRPVRSGWSEVEM